MKDGMALNLLMMEVVVAWQPVREVLKRFSRLQVGIEPTTLVGCSNHRATGAAGELGRLICQVTITYILELLRKQ